MSIHRPSYLLAFLAGSMMALPAHELAPPAPMRGLAHLECRTCSPAELLPELEEAVREGRIADPGRRVVPRVRPRRPRTAQPGLSCVSTAQIHVFEDTKRILEGPFSFAVFTDLMVQAANEVLSLHGDEFDFVGFFTNSSPQLLSPFYVPVENDVLGIGDPSGTGSPLFDLRPALGLAGSEVEGLIHFADVNALEPGDGPAADLTRLILAHELEHRFATYLPSLLDGRALQGGGGICGRGGHWSWRIDAQGSAMEISEWTGSSPATLASLDVFRNESFNTDLGGVFSPVDLYVLGLAEPAEVDSLSSELRYMDTATCTTTPYGGAISTFSAADLVAAAGPRVPGSASSQKHFRTAWVMLHLPGDPPTRAQLDRAVGVIEQGMIDWNRSTLGRSTMNNTLFDECSQAAAYGGGLNPPGSLTVVSGAPLLGDVLTLGIDNPLGTQSIGSVPYFRLAYQPDPAFPAGTPMPGLGMAGPGATGELLVAFTPATKVTAGTGPPWLGAGIPSPFPIPIPPAVELLGFTVYAQGVLWDPGAALGVEFALTEALQITIGP